jgi:hypothetical protein
MKQLFLSLFLVICLLARVSQVFAGNKDRSGQAGATELLIDPWARSTGVFGLNVANVSGVEAMKNNIAGLAFVEQTDMGISDCIYLTNSGVNIANAAVAQKIGNAGVIGINIMSMSFGDITMTDYNNPEGFGTYHPQFLNIELGFAKAFSNSVHAGVAATFVSEQVTNVSATGACFDAGVQYVTGKRDNFHFGITLRSIGTNMQFTGQGFSITTDNQPLAQPAYAVTLQYPSDKFEMPTNLNFGVAYDFFLDESHLKSKDDTPKHRLTVIGDFQSNSFNNDYLGVGVEYAFLETFMLRSGYRYENGIDNSATSTTIYTGLAVGASVQKRIGEGHVVALDYSFRPTNRPANGVHMFSIRYSRR